MLLRIQTVSDGTFLALQSDGVLTVEINSTLFNDQDVLMGSYSYPGKAPLEPNRAAIQNAHLITTSIDLRSMLVRVWLGQIPWTVAKFNFTVENGTIVYNLLIDNGIVGNKLKNVTLFSIGDTGNDGQMNFATQNDFYDYLLKTTTAAPSAEPCVFFPFKNDAAFKDIDSGTQPSYPDILFPLPAYINGWQVDGVTGAGQFIRNNYSSKINQNYIPFFYLTYVLKRIALWLGYQPVGKWLYEVNANKIVIYSNVPAAAPSSIADYRFHMPAIGVSDFLKEVRTRFGLLMSIDEMSKTFTFESISNLEQVADVVDLRPAQLVAYREESGARQGYQITQGYDNRDTAFTDAEKADPQVLNIGDVSGVIQVTDVQLKGVATKMITEASPAASSGANWKVPHIKQPIYGLAPFDQISAIDTTDRNNFGLRFLIYHGMQPNQSGFLYPYGSVDNIGYNGAKLTDFSLALDAPDTSFSATRHYYEFQRESKPFEMSFLLNSHAFLKLRATNKIAVRDFNDATVYCIVNSISADLGAKDQIVVKASLYPILLRTNDAELPEDVTGPVNPPEPPVDNGAVYVRMVIRNVTNENHLYPPPAYQTHDIDLYLQFYSDAAGMTPKEVTELKVGLRTKYYDRGGGYPPIESTYVYTVTSSGGEYLLRYKAPQSTTQGGVFRTWDYSLMTSADYNIIS